MNEFAFDVLNEQSEYWLGFLMADGCIYYPKKTTWSPEIKVELQYRDIEQVQKFKAFLCSNNKLVIQTKANKQYVAFSARSRRLIHILESYGICQRKSLTAKPINIAHSRHFWRGMVNGDGYFNLVQGHLHFEIVGSYVSMCQFATFIAQKLGNVYQINVYCQKAYRLIDILYSNCNIALDRKLERFNLIQSHGI